MGLFKNRYLVMEMVCQGRKLADFSFNHHAVTSAIHESLLANFGEHGHAASLSSLQGDGPTRLATLIITSDGCSLAYCLDTAVKYVNAGTGVCVIRCSRKQYRTVWAAITFITEIRNLPLFFNLLRLSGSISATRRAALQYDTKKLGLLKLDTRTSLSKEQLESAESSLSRLALLDN